jgi:hypothetical protein
MAVFETRQDSRTNREVDNMAASETNRRNAKTRTGSKSAAGKVASRQTADKNGRAEKGVAALDEIARTTQERVEQWIGVLKPAEGPEAWLVARAAALSARIDAAVRCESERREQARGDGQQPLRAVGDLATDAESLRRYEISLDRQLHRALQRAELLRRQRTNADAPLRIEPDAEPEPEAAPPAREVPEQSPEPFRRAESPTLAAAAIAEPIPPRRNRPIRNDNDQAVARVDSTTPPLRGRIPGRSPIAPERRGSYVSPLVNRPPHSAKTAINARTRTNARASTPPLPSPNRPLLDLVPAAELLPVR